MEINTPNREAMLDVISKINAVDGFDLRRLLKNMKARAGNPFPASQSPYKKHGFASNIRRGASPFTPNRGRTKIAS